MQGRSRLGIVKTIPSGVSKNFHSMVGTEVTRLQMLWKSPGLAVEEVSLLTSVPTF